MPTTLVICTFIHDPEVAGRVAHLCASQSWTITPGEIEGPIKGMLADTPDIIIFDQPSFVSQIDQILDEYPRAHAVYLGTEQTNTTLPDRCLHLDEDQLEQQLVYLITTTQNIARFDSQFFRQQQAEPITKLPHHNELLTFMTRFQGEPTGLIVAQIDHAEHLYDNLDPVSKTDLLGELTDHLILWLPHNCQIGIYDAASFVIWCPNMAAEEVAHNANRICQRGRVPLDFRGGELHFSLSVGYAYNATMTDPKHIWQQAWSTKEHVRLAGGNDVATTKSHTDIGERIPAALSRNEFGLVLQPQWDIQGRAIRGVESLLRWQGMEVGTIAPDQFIPIAEQSGQMARVGDWVLERASNASITWLEHLVAPMLLGINTSPQQFVNGAIKSQIERLADDQWLDPSILELEMTHNNLLHVVDQHRSTLFQIRDLGVRIAIDNIGVGIVDTNKLLRCPADTLKIDRSLVANIVHDTQARVLVEQICQVGKRFKLRVVAVGVETESQRRVLENLGCTDVQGYLFSAPIPLEKFQRYLANLLEEKTHNNTI